jgi:4-hydroxy-4-methyl-2-oxoglutarate aldolase
MTSWKNDDELFELMEKELFVAVIGDILDKLNFRNQFLPQAIQPIRNDMTVLGRAMTVLTVDYPGDNVAGQSEWGQMPFGLLFRALDDLKPNEVYVGTGGTPDYATWGELMATRAMRLGANGAVLDGFSRDTTGILDLNFPTFSRGGYAQDSGARSRVIDYRIPVQIGKVSINPGDLIMGDRDGVLVIPKEAEEEAISLALEKSRTEDLVKEAIENGMSTELAFKKYGVM